MKRIMLLTDIPPCTNYTAGLVTAQLCRSLPAGALSVFCVQNRGLKPEYCDDLAGLPIRTVAKTGENRATYHRGLKLPRVVPIGVELFRRVVRVPPLIRQAEAYAREQRAQVLWVVLQGQTMVGMAAPLAKRLGLPLLTHVWDPLSWWLRAHEVDRANRTLDLRAFDRAMRASMGCAAASWAMAEHYTARYGVPAVPIIAALDPALARHPPGRVYRTDTLTIGMAGQFYADAEWMGLLDTLQAMEWRVAGREVRLRVLGGHVPPGDIPPERLEVLGWRPQAEAVNILSEQCDVLFCGYPCSTDMREVAQLSFPAKLPTYFAAGRPVLFVGPADSSPGRYLAEHGAAARADAPDLPLIQAALLRLVEDPAWYASLAAAGQKAFAEDFTLARQRENFARFLSFVGVELT